MDSEPFGDDARIYCESDERTSTIALRGWGQLGIGDVEIK